MEVPSVPLLVPKADGPAPSRKIFSDQDMPNWYQSEAYHYIELVIGRLSLAVEGKEVDEVCVENEAVHKLVKFLEDLTALVDTIPLQSSPQRFGNKAFRDWITEMEKREGAFQNSLLSSSPSLLPVAPELSSQFRTSFGSGPRLDYGTGHELSFLAYLAILRIVGVFAEQDEQAMVTRCFATYLTLVRKLQKTFKLEPAGSKGVWGLDDHQHLSYLWGASQLRSHPTSRPDAILLPSHPRAVRNLFLSSILHINDIKTGPFAEHSPVLHNIATTVPNWAKVSTGLMRMYREEVLGKVPVVQHFRFGGILSWTKVGGDGTLMSSSGDGTEEEEVEGGESDGDDPDADRARDESTVAPWAIPSLTGGSGSHSPGSYSARPKPHSPLAFSRSSDTSTGVPIATPIVSDLPAPAVAPQPGTTAPRPFVPPDLFVPKSKPPSRLGSGSSASPGQRDFAHEETVAGSGGAAAGSSPFGGLPSATLGIRARREGLPWSQAESKDGQ